MAGEDQGSEGPLAPGGGGLGRGGVPAIFTTSRRWRLTLLWLAGMDLRVTLLAVPPLVPIIHAELGLDEKGVAALVTLPVLLFGLAAVPGSLLAARIGAHRTLLAGLVIIGLASAARGIGPSVPMLFAMTLVMGAGISISQPSMPTLVRQWFPTTVTRATGVWSSGLLIGELLGASLTLPLILPLAGGRWEVALALWAIPVLVTAGLLALTLSSQPAAVTAAGVRRAGWPDWRRARTWQLGLLQASSSLIYFGANTFLPDFLHSGGQPELVGLALTAVNLAQVPASFIVGLLPWRLLARRTTVLLAGGLALVGVAGLRSPSPWIFVGSAGLLGFISAYVLVVCFALPALLAAEADVTRLAAGGSTIGYSVAFASTLAAGALWDATQMPVSALLPILAGSTIILVLGPRLVSASAPTVASAAREQAS